ncbi:MAG TPA: flagellar motor switch protein FliG [bacterium]|nr:flagellar motor switch protein FliG [bacterium]
MAKDEKNTGIKKAAMMMVALGPEIAADIFKHMSDNEIERLTLEIASLNKLSPKDKAGVLEEFYNLAMAKEYILAGGIDYARDVLERALGTGKAMDVINRLSTFLDVAPFEFARKSDPNQLLNFIRNEHPQTIALVLSYLSPAQSSYIMKALNDPALQVSVTKRIALMDRTSPEVIKEVEKVLEKKLSMVLSPEYTEAGGIGGVVEILNRVGRKTESEIMDKLSEEDPELAEEIKKRMFVFEDIVKINDRDLQQVLRQVESAQLATALKNMKDEVQQKVYGNMSKRAAEMLKEDMDFAGPVRLREIEEAQQHIVNTIRGMIESGEISDYRSEGGEML